MATEYFRSSLFAQEMEDTWTGTVRFNAEQELSESQKAQARNNIGAVAFGSLLKILGHYDTIEALQVNGEQKAGNAYSVGTVVPYKLYVFDGLSESWVDYGYIRSQDISSRSIQNVTVSTSAWIQDTAVLTGYSYKAQIALADSTAECFPIVVFESEQAFGGNFAPVSFAVAGFVEVFAKEIPTKNINILSVTVIVNGGVGKGITNASAGVTAGSIGTENLVDGSVTARKIADECKNIIKENVALAAAAFNEDNTVDGASYKAELAVTGSTAAMLPLIAWTAAQSEELEVKRIESAAGKIVIYSANAPSADLTIPTVALISPIGTGSSGASGGSGDDTPDYVLTAADALAKKTIEHVSSDNIVFAVMADAHLGYYTDTANAAGKQAGQALKRLNERCALDFVVHVGDYTTGAWNTTADDTLEDNADYQLLIGSKFPGRAVWCPGNHDDAPYQATASRLTQTQMYAAIGRKNLASGGYTPSNACYGYMDFPGLHLRVIYLDTHDHRSWETTQLGSGVNNPYLDADNISATQLQYLVDHALNFSGISDPSQWSILVFSHAALNGTGSYTDPVSGTVHPSNTANAATLLKAYATKQSGSITHGDSTVNYDFSAVTPAQIIACIHGHEHRYANETVGGAFLSICCPNIMNGRERASADGNTYTKTAGTANGTSFCVFSINRTDKKIYVDHYGPGLDREFTYTVPDPNAPSYTNQLPLATDTNGSVYNGMGYASGQRLNSSGAAEGYNGSYLTGFIPVKIGDVVRLKNVTWQNGVTTGLNSGNQRISFYSADKAHLGQTNAIGLGGTLSGVKDANGIWTQFTVKNFSGGNLANAAFFRLNCAGITAESIITVNEEITEA